MVSYMSTGLVILPCVLVRLLDDSRGCCRLRERSRQSSKLALNRARTSRKDLATQRADVRIVAYVQIKKIITFPPNLVVFS
jgi:hypothetical protein